MSKYENMRVMSQALYFSSNSTKVPSIDTLQKIGAGHDGIVYRSGDKAIKILKYDLDERKVRDLMTYEKARYFLQNLKLKRIAQPQDILFNEDGVYSGYVMPYYEDVVKSGKRKIETFTLLDLHNSIHDLIDDFNEISDARVLAHDINDGSYIVASDFLRMCDMDKFNLATNKSGPREQNKASLNYLIAHYLYLLMAQGIELTKEERKLLNRWVKKASNDSKFLTTLQIDGLKTPSKSVVEFAKEKAKTMI